MHKSKKFQKEAGFTLIELLVVISIIGLLASIVLTSLTTARQKARFAKIQSDAQSIETQVNLKRVSTIIALTGSGCTACNFYNSQTIQSQSLALPSNTDAWKKIGFSPPPLDPWNNPYTLDENEQEFNSADCRFDVVYSAGPNGIWEGFATPTIPDIVVLGVGDDYAFALSHGTCVP